MPKQAPFGYQRGEITVPATVATGTSAEEYLTDLVPGFTFTVEKVSAIVQVAGAGAGATRLFRLVKGASTVVASATIALAAVGTKGAVIDLPVTAADATFGDSDKVTLDVTAAGTAYSTLGLVFRIQYRAHPQQKA